MAPEVVYVCEEEKENIHKFSNFYLHNKIQYIAFPFPPPHTSVIVTLHVEYGIQMGSNVSHSNVSWGGGWGGK